jgi:site-specific DNA-methyltransferase (adenine-specific)
MLPDALVVMADWGFDYRTCAFVWVKTTKSGQGVPFRDSSPPLFWGCGQWTRSNTEFCLLGIRGKVKVPEDRSVHQVVCAPVGRHSAKPAEARRRIERMFPGVRRLELFAREAAPGWDSWGDQVEEPRQLEAAL